MLTSNAVHTFALVISTLTTGPCLCGEQRTGASSPRADSHNGILASFQEMNKFASLPPEEGNS